MEAFSTVRPSLDGNHFDVVVIGGGISGVAIARECAQSGKRVLLLEQNDFASGTTSRSTRIIHGGLRYLEHGELGLVRECLKEREHLLRQQPHLVRPMQFLLALKPGMRHNALAIRAGLWVYKALAGQHGLNSSSKEDCRLLEEQLDHGVAFSTFCYEDAQCEFPELLVAEWLADALQSDCVARNHAQVLDLKIDDGRARAVVFHDQLDGTEQTVEASWIINATGPWCDRVCQQFSLRGAKRLVGGVRGSHIVLPAVTGLPHSAIYTEAADHRPFFVIPWNGQLLVGTTEVADEEDPGETKPSQMEIDYLLSSFTSFFPRQHFTKSDVRYAFAGVRPLPYSPDKTPQAITRRHFLHDHSEEGAAGLISVIGGKLTTAASLARQCARKIGARREYAGTLQIALAPLDGVETTLRQWSRHIALFAGIPECAARALAEWHGRRALVIARLAARAEEYRAPLCQHTVHIVAEAVAAFRSQHAITLGDVLLRRTPAALGACWSEECSAEAAHKIGQVMGWSSTTIQKALEEFEEERTKFLNPSSSGRPLVGPTLPNMGKCAA
ncbi:MAG TPA: glycerol-3-phosphate dehydrogenase/oxidase [Terriglobales bacterium]|nr:glycerol-3-phosphate dehydrogenase/oxidase [Terriglobales bacterium]